jgi:hypothetical protein
MITRQGQEARVMLEDRTTPNRAGEASSLSHLAEVRQLNSAGLKSIVIAVAGIGVLLCLVAAVIGLRIALHATVVPCPDGHDFPAGTTDFRCFAHKRAGSGTVIVLFAVTLGIVVALAGLIAHTQLRRQNPR